MSGKERWLSNGLTGILQRDYMPSRREFRIFGEVRRSRSGVRGPGSARNRSNHLDGSRFDQLVASTFTPPGRAAPGGPPDPRPPDREGQIVSVLALATICQRS